MNHSVSLMDYEVYAAPLDVIDIKKRTVINTINQYSYCIAEEDQEFKAALQQSDVLLPDGIGITSAHLLLNGKKIKKIAGADIHKYLLEQLNRNHGTCFYLGSTNSTLEKIKMRLKLEYPNIQVATYSPPYKPVFTEEDSKAMVEAINAANPDVLFVGMTAPKQEKWATAYKNQLNARVICSIGAVFDFYAGTVERPSKIWIGLGLEWFVRLLKEPKRMQKRYLYYGPIFGIRLLQERFKKKE